MSPVRGPSCAVKDPFCSLAGGKDGATVTCFRCRCEVCLSCAFKWPVFRHGRQWVCHDCAGALPDGIEGVRTHLSRLAGRLYNLAERRRVPVAAPVITEAKPPPPPPRTAKRQRTPLVAPERPARARPYPKARMEHLGYGTESSSAR